jgi:hypothetical protein
MTDSLRYSFVTVGFPGEAGLLRLQARSLRLYCPVHLVEEIILVDNSQSNAAGNWTHNLLHHYGALAPLVRIVPAAQLAIFAPETGGWWTQQLLKIKVANVVRSPRCVLLDAKNHLIRPLTRDFLETPSGQPRINGHSFLNDPMREFLQNTLQYLGLDPAPHLSWFTRTTTPFTMLTSEARALDELLQAREGSQLAAAFQKNKLTEFFLYSGFLLCKGPLANAYDLDQPHCIQIWEQTANESGCAEAICKAERSECPFFSVHSKAIAKMDKNARGAVANFWSQRGLFPSPADAARFLREPNRCFQSVTGRLIPQPLAFLFGWLNDFRSRSQVQGVRPPRISK